MLGTKPSVKVNPIFSTKSLFSLLLFVIVFVDFSNSFCIANCSSYTDTYNANGSHLFSTAYKRRKKGFADTRQGPHH